jgi:Meiotically up-regulated gene 113
MIYFIQSTDGGPIKIGYTDDISRRTDQLERHYGCALNILATMKGGPDEEAVIHAQFAHLRLKGPGRCGRPPEQFRPAPELMAFIGRPMLVGANPDAVEAIIPVGYDASLKPVRVELSDDVHRMLRKLAADDGVSMAAFARESVERMVREEFKRRGLK